MKDITINPTYKKIRRRILSLRKINFSKLSDIEIINLWKKSFNFPIKAFPQKPAIKAIYRARINEDASHNYIIDPYNDKKEITYSKNPTKYGRCNIIGKPVFYGADGLDIAVSESCADVLNSKNSILYLTVGEWKLKKDIEVSIICHSKKAHRKSGDLIIAYQSLLKLKKNTAASKNEIRIWKIINKYLSGEFSKKVSQGEECKYKSSALFSNSLLKSKMVSGIYYPSVGYRFYGHNVAYDTNLIDDGSIILESAKHVKCTFIHKNKAPKIEVLNSTHSIDGDHMIWK